MLVEIPRDELALITAHYHRERDKAREQIDVAEKRQRETSPEELAAMDAMGFETVAEQIETARQIIAYCTARLEHYSKIF